MSAVLNRRVHIYRIDKPQGWVGLWTHARGADLHLTPTAQHISRDDAAFTLWSARGAGYNISRLRRAEKYNQPEPEES